MPSAIDRVWIRQNRWLVERLRREGATVRYDVVARHERRTFLAPFDRPLHRQGATRIRYGASHQTMARLRGLVGRAFTYRTIASAIAADVELLPHQLSPAQAIQRGARRVLIADDVGLGKTIQAGVILAETLRRQPAARVLIALPASLADQWAGELARRFRIETLIADRAGLDRLAADSAAGDSPWLRGAVWIASLDFLKQPHVVSSLPPSLWDLVIIDEAHTACGDSVRYDACQAIASTARVLVLLTATPHDGDTARFERLLAMGVAPGCADRIEVFRRTRRDLQLQHPRRVRWQRVRLSEAEIRTFECLSGLERAVIHAAGASRRDAALLLLAVFRKRAVSTMGALAISLRRRLEWIEGRVPEDDGLRQGQLSFDEGDDFVPGESAALASDVGLDPRRERTWLKRAIALAETARRFESKARWIADFAARIRDPIVAFTEFRDSLEVLRRRIDTRRVIACLHGGQTGSERHIELARFLNGEASVLIATDVASLGLNLQARARAVVNLELPWNPMRLEQRAGRVDRIGQTRPVHITLLVADHEAEAPVLTRLAERVLIARRATGDDAMATCPLDESIVRETALLGSAAPRPATPPMSLPPSRRWSRPSLAAARELAHHRAWRAHWRAPVGHPRTPRWTFVGRLTQMRDLARSALVVFVVPLVDASGAVVESHLVAVRADAGTLDMKRLVAATTSRARESLIARARRVARRLRCQLSKRIAREETLSARLALSRRSAEAQPGLFDRRVIRSLETANTDAEAILDEMRRRIADFEASASIEVGDPVVAVVILNRP